MKRDILFRGKSIETNKWVYGSLVQSPDSGNVYIHIHESVLSEPETNSYDILEKRIEVLPDSVGQQTTFKDKHNKLIFEGDIINDGLGVIMFDNTKAMFGVKWNERFFKIFRTFNCEPLFENSNIVWEIIGNLTDTPELLYHIK